MVATASLVGIGLASVALPALALVAVASRHWDNPGARGFVVALAGVALWSLTTGGRVLADGLWLGYWAAVGQLVATNVTNLGWALLVADFCHRRRIRIASPWVLAVLVIPASTIVLALTNPVHHLIYTTATHATDRGSLVLAFGPWYPVHVGYILAVSVGAAVYLLREVPGSSGLHRR